MVSGSASKVSLKSYDDLFSTGEIREETGSEKVQIIFLNELHPFAKHPFKVKDDEAIPFASLHAHDVIIAEEYDTDADAFGWKKVIWC